MPQNSQIDSLTNLLNTSKDTIRVNILNSLGDLVYRSDPNIAIKYGEEAKKLSESLQYELGLAYALKNIGLGYFNQGNYAEAAFNWEQSLDVFRSMNDENGVANIIGNLGAAYSSLGDDVKAIDFFLQSISIAEKSADSVRIATCLLNIGYIYSGKAATHDKAKDYYLSALHISELIDYEDAIGFVAYGLGDLYYQRGEYDTALAYFKETLQVYENPLDLAPSLNYIGKIFAERGEFNTAIKYQFEALEMAETAEMKLEMAQIYLGLADTYHKNDNSKTSIVYFQKARDIALEIESNYDLRDAYAGLAHMHADLSDYKNAYEYQTLLSDIEKTIYNIETDDKIKNLLFTHQLDKKQDEIEILEQKSEIEQLKIKRQKSVSWTMGITGILLLIIAVILYNRFKFAQKTKSIIQKEKDRSDNLLLNILPSKTAEELKQTGKAKAQKYESVTILFTDFKEFTSIAADLDPEVLVQEINQCYVRFDEIVTKYGVEKIKTIGDAYMAAGGIPVRNTTHPLDVINAAFEIRDYMLQLKAERERENKLFFEIRIGIHSGPVVAGIVGTKKFAYDIWGDTVNCAARLEAASEPGKINISETTYQLIKEEYNCDYRGEIEAKNRGKLKMYFVGSRKSMVSEIHA